MYAIRSYYGRLVDLGLADAGRMDVGLVREVHQVVDHQLVVALDVVDAAAMRPGRVVGPEGIVDQRRVGLVGLAGPHPDETVSYNFV